MKTENFTSIRSTVVATVPQKRGNEIWVRYEDGREVPYQVAHPDFLAREGQQMTALMFGQHVVALRNDSAKLKIQLLTAEDLLGSAQTRSRSGLFWIGYIILLLLIPILVDPAKMFLESFDWDKPFIVNLLESGAAWLQLGVLVGFPYWFIIRPGIRRFKHRRKIKAADKIITDLFNQL